MMGEWSLGLVVMMIDCPAVIEWMGEPGHVDGPTRYAEHIVLLHSSCIFSFIGDHCRFFFFWFLFYFSLSSFARVKGLLSSLKSFGFPSFSEGVDFFFFLFSFSLPFLTFIFGFFIFAQDSLSLCFGSCG